LPNEQSFGVKKSPMESARFGKETAVKSDDSKGQKVIKLQPSNHTEAAEQ